MRNFAAAAIVLLVASSAVAQPCPCDCDADRTVRVSELMTGVNISFDRLGMERCPPADVDGDGAVAVNDLVAGVGAALHGCPPQAAATPTPVTHLLAADLAAARARWQGIGLRHYQYRYRIGCFCPGPLDVVMEVFDNRIVEMRSPETGLPVTPPVVQLFFTVDGLFDYIENALGYAEIVNVQFDPVTGYPTEVFIDGSLLVADDELWVNVSDLRPLTSELACRTSDDCQPSFAICVEPGGFVGCGICFDHPAQCESDGDCGDGTRICEPIGHNSDTCACDPSVRVCVAGCEGDADCGAGKSCDPSHHCVAIHCSDDAPCPANFSCILPGDAATGLCLRTICDSDAECAADAGFCVAGECHQRPGHCALTPP